MTISTPERPPLNLTVLWCQLAIINANCMAVARASGKMDPNQPSLPDAAAEARYQKLMARVSGPNDDPLGTDWR